MRSRRTWVAAGWAVLLAGLAPAAADEAVDAGVVASRIPSRETAEEGDHLTGDWGGFRSRLVERGIHFSAGYTGEYLANVSGGVERGGAYAGLLELALDLDGAALLGWEGSELKISSLYPHGESISERVGDVSTVSNIDAYDTLRLYEFWAEQRFWGDRLSVRLGQLAADEEFAVTEHGSLFINSTFGWPAFYSLNTPAPAYPLPALGARVRFDVGDELTFLAGVFDGDPGDEPFNSSGTRVRLGSDEGALLSMEAIYSPRAWPMSGTYKLGGWYHTGEFAHQRVDDTGGSLALPGSSGVPGAVSGNWGVYLVVDQPLWREEGEGQEQGVNGFFRAAGSPSDRNFLGYYLDGGLVYTGLMPGRDEDLAGIALGYLRIGDEARRVSREAGGGLDHEIVLEVSYQIKLNSWCSVQPDLQYIVHPGGSGELSNALVVGLRSSIVF